MIKENTRQANRAKLMNRIQLRIGSILTAILLSTLLVGCATPFSRPTPKIKLPGDVSAPRKLVIFFDGTKNNESSNTNIFKLHQIVAAQIRPDIGTFYIEGVGANCKLIGMGAGWGVSYRVKLAYEYLAENYREGDEIYLFGFSRGAYSARILASMLYHAGLPEQQIQKGAIRKDFASVIYDAFKGDMTREERKKAVRDKVTEINSLYTLPINRLPKLKPVDVKFMGLWDTVEALGLPDLEENVILPNRRYGDQLCNVLHAAHALSLDDDRARVFTPILLTQPHLLEHCTKDGENAKWSQSPDCLQKHLNEVVNEVWFTGAHADVGGGYKDEDTGLSGVTLDWMISQLSPYNVIPKGTKACKVNPAGAVHDPEAGAWGLLYRQKWRSFMDYATKSPYNHGKLKIHETVVKRLERPEESLICPAYCPPKEYPCPFCQSRSSQWRLPELFPYCFSINSTGGYNFTESPNCLLTLDSMKPSVDSEPHCEH